MSPDDLPQLLEIERNRTRMLANDLVQASGEILSYKRQALEAQKSLDSVREQLDDALNRERSVIGSEKIYRRMFQQQRDFSIYQSRKFSKDLQGMGKGLSTKDKKIKELRKELEALKHNLDATRTINLELNVKIDKLTSEKLPRS